MSPSGFYAWQQRPASPHAVRDRQLRILIRASHEASRRTYGNPRVLADLPAQGVRVSRKRVARLMQTEGLGARLRKRFRSTTLSEHDQPIAGNVLGAPVRGRAPESAVVAAATAFVIGSSAKLYLAAIMDLHSRFIVGWALSAVNDRHLTLSALEKAVKRRRPDAIIPIIPIKAAPTRARTIALAWRSAASRVR